MKRGAALSTPTAEPNATIAAWGWIMPQPKSSVRTPVRVLPGCNAVENIAWRICAGVASG